MKRSPTLDLDLGERVAPSRGRELKRAGSYLRPRPRDRVAPSRGRELKLPRPAIGGRALGGRPLAGA